MKICPLAHNVCFALVDVLLKPALDIRGYGLSFFGAAFDISPIQDLASGQAGQRNA